MALAHCILDKFLGVGCHCFPPPLDVPTFSARCLHVQRRERPLAAEGGNLHGREMLDAQYLKFILFWNNTLHILDGLSVHHQESKNLHTASGVCQTGSVAAC